MIIFTIMCFPRKAYGMLCVRAGGIQTKFVIILEDKRAQEKPGKEETG